MQDNVGHERLLLGALLIDSDRVADVAEILRPEDFCHVDYGRIYQHMVALREPFDAFTLGDKMPPQVLEHLGGTAFLAGIAKDCYSPGNAVVYAQAVKQGGIKNKVDTTLRELTKLQRQEADAEELLNKCEQAIFAIRNSSDPGKDHFKTAKSALMKVVHRIEAAMNNGSGITGMRTGISSLDAITGGLTPGQLVIVAGRPAMGKTTLALNIAEHVAIAGKRPVAMFSMEMSEEELMAKMVASIAGIDFGRIKSGRLQEEDWQRLTKSGEIAKDMPFEIDDTPANSITVEQMMARARRFKRKHGDLGLIVVDYLQLIKTADTANRANDVAKVSVALKQMAKELGCPVIALSQLNRSLEQRPNKRPMMSDLRESGAIEQDADIIVFVYRDEVYDKNSQARGRAELIIGKQRNGPTGTLHTMFNGSRSRFSSMPYRSA